MRAPFRKVPREGLVFISLEDEQLAGMTADQLRLLPDEYDRPFPALRQRELVTWCLNEIPAPAQA